MVIGWLFGLDGVLFSLAPSSHLSTKIHLIVFEIRSLLVLICEERYESSVAPVVSATVHNRCFCIVHYSALCRHTGVGKGSLMRIFSGLVLVSRCVCDLSWALSVSRPFILISHVQVIALGFSALHSPGVN